MTRPIQLTLLLLLVLASSSPAQETQPATPAPQPSQEELEKQFSEKMTGATLVGRFTIEGQGDEQPLREERYTLGKVAKLPNGRWLIEARIQYGERDVKLPLALELKWAGDTPVITVTDVAFPGLGTYTARVLFYRDQYAGTWSGREHGGHLFGRIERAGEAQPAEKPEK